MSLEELRTTLQSMRSIIKNYKQQWMKRKPGKTGAHIDHVYHTLLSWESFAFHPDSPPELAIDRLCFWMFNDWNGKPSDEHKLSVKDLVTAVKLPRPIARDPEIPQLDYKGDQDKLVVLLKKVLAICEQGLVKTLPKALS